MAGRTERNDKIQFIRITLMFADARSEIIEIRTAHVLNESMSGVCV